MKRKIKFHIGCALSASLLAGCVTTPTPHDSALISAPSKYEGYSFARFDGYKRTSFYIPMRDGTRLAADLFRPTLNGVLVDEKFPVVWMHTPYNRRDFRGQPAAEAYPGYALRLVPYGYNVALVDFRGVFASEGKNIGYNRGEWLEPAKWDAYDVTEWFADQSYSNGNIGMWGCSATGGSQMQSLTVNPPSLKAVVPMSAEYDAYAFAMLGGVSRERPIAPPGQIAGSGAVAARDRLAVAVDGRNAEAELAAAIAEHASNRDTVGHVPYRDSYSEAADAVWWKVSSPHTYADTLAKSEVGVLSIANWDEAGTRHGPFFTFNNLNPDQTKLLVGPATHCDWSTVKQETGFDLVTEELRFYDYWLKGIDNKVMTEPAVTYYTYNAEPEKSWQQAEKWPLPKEQRTDMYLTADGRLSKHASSGQVSVAFSAAPKAETVSQAVPDGGFIFETDVLDSDLQVTGHPVIELWIKTHAQDADVTANLLDVAPDGRTETYQMLGRLRASHRKLSQAPYNNLGLPWHSSLQADSSPLPAGEPVELKFDMLPMSYIFKKGHKVRLQVSFAHPDRNTSGGQVEILMGGDRRSKVELPVIPAE